MHRGANATSVDSGLQINRVVRYVQVSELRTLILESLKR